MQFQLPNLRAKEKSSKAFSLIEVSVVLLIIGIFIAGILIAGNLVRKSRIAAAQSLTRSSPINTIQDSALWLESSVDSNFGDGDTVDGHAISNW